MKYKPWGWVDVFEDGKIQVGTMWQEGQEETAGYIRFLPDVTGGEELVTEEVKRVMAALDFVEECVVLPCGSHCLDLTINFVPVGGVFRVKTYFIYLGEHDESE